MTHKPMKHIRVLRNLAIEYFNKIFVENEIICRITHTIQVKNTLIFFHTPQLLHIK